MKNIKRGDIYWISADPFHEAIGHVQRADRPGVIVSSDRINRALTIHTIVYLTTSPRADVPTHCTIRSAKEESTALCEQITTVDEAQLGNYIGHVTEAEMKTIETCMCINLDLGNPANITIDAEAEEEEEEIYEEYDQEEIDKLKLELAKAKREAEVLRDLYNNLLQSALKKR